MEVNAWAARNTLNLGVDLFPWWCGVTAKKGDGREEFKKILGQAVVARAFKILEHWL